MTSHMQAGDAVKLWRTTGFPRGSSNDALDEIHAQLAVVDTWVADCVIDFQTSGRWIASVPDVLAELVRLDTALERLELTDAIERTLREEYRRYIRVLAAGYREFLSWGNEAIHQ